MPVKQRPKTRAKRRLVNRFQNRGAGQEVFLLVAVELDQDQVLIRQRLAQDPAPDQSQYPVLPPHLDQDQDLHRLMHQGQRDHQYLLGILNSNIIVWFHYL